MYSVGIDLIEIKRIEKSMRNKRFLNRILSDHEYKELTLMKFLPKNVAVNFCAKEAVLKALGKGLGDLKLNEIELLRHKSGQPYIIFEGNALKLVKEQNLKFSVSATHTKEYANVVVIAYK